MSGFPLSLAVAGVALVVALAAVGFCWLSRPNQLRREFEQLSDLVHEFGREQTRAAAERLEYLKAVESIQDAVRDDLDRAEKKRKSAAAKESRLGHRQGGEQIDPNNRDHLVQLARARGIDVQ